MAGSKSFTNRALIIAAMAEGPSRLSGILRSDDSYWCVNALRMLGIPTEISGEGDTVDIQGCGCRWPNKNGALFLGSSGTLARFLPGALAVSGGGEWDLDATEQLRSRPVATLVDALRSLGASIEYLADHTGLPIRVRGGGLIGGTVSISGKVSSQFLSGILIAAPYARQPVRVEVVDGLVQPAYIGITIELMREFGAQVEHSPDYQAIRVEPRPYREREYTLEADASTACYFLSLAAITGGRIRVTNVGHESLQPDARLVDVLERMGCGVSRGQRHLEVQGPKQLRGGIVVDMKPMSDQALTLGALAPFADGPVTVANVAHIRKHESDRIASIYGALSKMGVRVEEHADGFTVHPGMPQAAVLDPHDDHRNAMAFSLIGARVPGIQILDPGCVSKTCPTYFDELAKLGVGVAFRPH